MTEPTITQADREAAAKYCKAAGLPAHHIEPTAFHLARHREAADARARIEGARMEWRSIESAPKHGAGVLLIDMTALFPQAVTAYFYDQRWWMLDRMDRSEPESDGCPWMDTPTHWMPLPEPPGAIRNLSPESIVKGEV